jgi:hypothetical protein
MQLVTAHKETQSDHSVTSLKKSADQATADSSAWLMAAILEN